MKHFYLLFLPSGKGWTGCAEAYVCAGSPGGGFEKPDPRAGHHLLTIESTSEAECHQQIDKLIIQLQHLKREASRWFERHEKK